MDRQTRTYPLAWKITGSFFMFAILVTILILVCLDFFTPKQNSEIKNANVSTDVMESTLLAILGKDQIRWTGKLGNIRLGETSKHKIKLIPTYHGLRDQVNQFLSKKKEFKNDVYIVVDGEPNPIPRQNIDLVITSKKDNLQPSDIYVPYYVMMCQEHHKNLGELMEPSVPNRSSFDDWMQRKFLAFCYSNDNMTRYSGCADRARFYQILSKKLSSRARNLGNQMKHAKSLITDDFSIKERNCAVNHIMLREYKFVVAFENEQLNGYITEKLANPLFAGCIPIYLGADDVNEHFNPRSFINVKNYASFEDCVNDLILLDSDEVRLKEYLNTVPLIHDKYLGLLKTKGSSVLREFSKGPLGYLIPNTRLLDERAHLITFVPMVNNKNLSNNIPSCTKIVSQGKLSRCFDDIVSLNYNSLPYELLNQHQDFMTKNKDDNYGFGIWKPYLMKNYMGGMVDNDIMCFLSTSFDLNSNIMSRLPHYFQLLKDAYNNGGQQRIKTKPNLSKHQPPPNRILISPSKPCIAAFTSPQGSKLCMYHTSKHDLLWNSILLTDDVYQSQRIRDLSSMSPRHKANASNATIDFTAIKTTVEQRDTYNVLVEKPHMSADFIVVLKTPESMKFLRQWTELCNNHANINSFLANPEKEHVLFQKNHDHESAFSCLFHITNQLIFQ